ncbi:hypothetical protein F0562_017805 [Nyssa sinensis]|uniref:BTB domain-containing protein n=1 Tax=Nyssa sinensis TaxID=561372 RepID=A0A5J4ZG79_9ASTE|nr:hypothetical protein F0562_017805 [Nyssa sinensis]
MKSKRRLSSKRKSLRCCSRVKVRSNMVSESSVTSFNRPPTPKFCNSFANRIFSDVAGDITIAIDGESFLLHKFPLVSRSGKIRKMVADGKDSNVSKLELLNFPGGPQTFELAAKFCYGMNFEITSCKCSPSALCCRIPGND